MIGEHFWKIVFVVALLVGGYFYYEKWHADSVSEDRMVAVLDLIEQNKDLPESATVEEAAIPLFQLLVKLHNYVRFEDVQLSGMLDAVFTRALDEERVASEEIEPFKVALTKNMELGEKYGVFDGEGILLMENGRSPEVTKGAFKGEKLLVGHFVSPTLAPEGRNSLANLVLTPETVFALQTDDIDRSVENAAGRLRQIRAINPSTMDRLNRRRRDQTVYQLGEP